MSTWSFWMTATPLPVNTKWAGRPIAATPGSADVMNTLLPTPSGSSFTARKPAGVTLTPLGLPTFVSRAVNRTVLTVIQCPLSTAGSGSIWSSMSAMPCSRACT